jgi:hypothetical protein
LRDFVGKEYAKMLICKNIKEIKSCRCYLPVY